MTDKLDIWFDAFAASLETLLSEFAEFIPSLLAAIVILIIGYIISRILRSAVKLLLTRFGIDKLAKKFRCGALYS